jgi:hypothetical protein
MQLCSSAVMQSCSHAKKKEAFKASSTYNNPKKDFNG